VTLFKDLFNNVVHYLTLKLKVLTMRTMRAINWQSRMRSSCLLCVFIRSRICISVSAKSCNMTQTDQQRVINSRKSCIEAKNTYKFAEALIIQSQICCEQCELPCIIQLFITNESQLQTCAKLE